MDFIAIEIETANLWRDSICSIGLVKIVDNQVVDTLFTYINPDQPFDEYHTSHHGITEDMVRFSSAFEDFYPILNHWLTNQIVIAYYRDFDESVIEEACTSINKLMPYCHFGDILSFSKQNLKHLQFYTLQSIASQFNISLDKERAEIIAELILRFEQYFNDFALSKLTNNQSQLSVQNSSFSSPTDFQGKTIVFTGGLEGLTRSMAAKKIRSYGGIFSNTVTKQTDMLIVSNSSWQKAQSGQKSSKLQKAEQLQADGFAIKIIPEEKVRTYFK